MGNKYFIYGTISAAIMMLMISCGIWQERPSDPLNICSIFLEKPNWYKAAKASSRTWAIPVPVMMAIMYHESKFQARAKPPRTTCLFVLPGPRMSSAYGYCQAIDSTWALYQKSTGNIGADRDNFSDAIDFIGWYCALSHSKCGIRSDDAFHHYVAYHEGQTGFLTMKWKHNRWLKNKAWQVHSLAETYTRQLAFCEDRLVPRPGCFLNPF